MGCFKGTREELIEMINKKRCNIPDKYELVVIPYDNIYDAIKINYFDIIEVINKLEPPDHFNPYIFDDLLGLIVGHFSDEVVDIEKMNIIYKVFNVLADEFNILIFIDIDSF